MYKNCLILLFPVLLAYGCTSDDAPKEPQIYHCKVNFVEPYNMKVLYKAEREIIPKEYAKLNISGPVIAQLRLATATLHSQNEYEKFLIPVVKKEVKKMKAAYKVQLKQIALENKTSDEIKALKDKLAVISKQIQKRKKQMIRGRFKNELKR